MRYVIALLIALVFNAGANVLMKIGMKTVAASGGLLKDGPVSALRTILTSATLLAGLTLFIFNAAFYMYALQSKDLKISLAYPIMVGGGFALIAVVARIHPTLAERLTAGQIMGVVFVLIGIALIAFQTEPA